MKWLKLSETQILGALAVVAGVSGAACLILTVTAPVPSIGGKVQEIVRSFGSSAPEPVPTEKYVPYVWTLTDLYEVAGERLKPKLEAPRWVKAALNLVWEGSKGAYVQLASNREFNGKERTHLKSAAESINLDFMYVGPNFWRVSRDGLEWSKEMGFTLEPEFLKTKTWLTRERDTFTAQSDGEIQAYVIEYSNDPKFAPGSVMAFTRMGREVQFSFAQQGYLRARGVNAKGELTAYSEVMTSDGP